MIKKAMILAAGFGRRLNPLTLNCPKPLLKVGKETLLSNTINFLEQTEIKEAVINIHYLGDKIIEYLNKKKFNLKITIINEKEKIKYKVGKFPFLANSRAKVNNESEGFVKIIAEEKTDKVLGVSLISSLAGTMIAELALAMEFGASAEDIARTCHAHPTHSEAVKEAAMAVDKRPIHF